MFFILFGKLGTSVCSVNARLNKEMGDLLFTRPTTTRILVYQWRINYSPFLDAFLNPEVRLDVFI